MPLITAERFRKFFSWSVPLIDGPPRSIYIHSCHDWCVGTAGMKELPGWLKSQSWSVRTTAWAFEMISFDDENDYAILIMFFSRDVDCFTALVDRFWHPRWSILRDLSGGMKDVEHCRSNAEPEADVADTPWFTVSDPPPSRVLYIYLRFLITKTSFT